MLVFYDVLLDEGGSGLQALALSHCVIVDLSVWEESAVAWNMLGDFLGTNRELIFFVAGNGVRIVGQQVSWIVSKCSDSLVELSIVAASR